MSAGAVARWLVAWVVVTAFACVLVRAHFALRSDPASDVVVASVWNQGELVGRAAVARPGDDDPALDAALAAHPGATRVDERIVGDGPVASWTELTLAMSMVPGREGLAATLDGRTVYVTPDELLARQAYDKAIRFPALELGLGVDARLVLALLGDRLHVRVGEMLARGELWRFRAERVQNPGLVHPRPSP